MRRLTILFVILTFSAGLTVLIQVSSVVNVLGEAAVNDFGYAVAVDSAGNIVVTGTTESSGAGLDDVFIAKYSPSKVQLWSVMWGGSGNDQGYGVAVDLVDNIIVAGQTYSFGAGDADAFVAKYSSSGVQLWNRTWGGSNSECGYGVTVDSANNIVITGYTNSLGAGFDDVFIAKYSASGVQLWNNTWGKSYNDQSHGVAVDSVDNIVVAGYTDLSGGSVYDALVVKYSSSGELQWNLTMGGGDDFGYGIAVDSSDNIIITGYKFVSSTSSWDAFVAKCHPSGVQLWNRTFGGSGDDHGYGISVDSTDDIVIVGETNSFGANLDDLFIAKYSSFGGKLWNTTWGGEEDDYGRGVAVDSVDDAVVAGYTNSFGASGYDAFVLHVSAAPLSYATWGGLTIDEGRDVAADSEDNILLTGYTDSYGAGSTDAFVAKYSSLGVQQLNFTWGGDAGEYGYDVAIDSIDNVIVTGCTGSFGAGGYDAFIVKYSSSGIQLWNTTWGGNYYDRGYGVVVDSANNVIATGSTRSFGAGGYDAFVVKYSSSGIQQWNLTWGGSNYDYGYSVAVDSSDNIIITGSTKLFFADNENAFVVKYSSAGLQLWNTTWGGSGTGYGYDVAVDSANNLIMTGQTSSFVGGNNDAFVVKYSSSGVPQWSRVWGGSYNDCGYGVAVDTEDDIVMTGETYSSVSDGTGAFVVKYSSLGVQLWSRVWGGSESDYGYGVAVDSTTNIVMVGTTESFGAGSSDAFISKYPTSGFQFWYIIWEAPGEKTHDIAIASLSLSKAIVGQGYTVKINVNVTNQGEAAEAFNVTAYVNTTAIEEQTVTGLAPSENLTLSFTWDTTSFAKGNYTISANATIVLGETDTADNTLVNGVVMVTIPGDVNGDTVVDILDAGEISAHWYPGPPVGPLGYDANTDINHDGEVDIFDAAIVSANWQKSW